MNRRLHNDSDLQQCDRLPLSVHNNIVVVAVVSLLFIIKGSWVKEAIKTGTSLPILKMQFNNEQKKDAASIPEMFSSRFCFVSTQCWTNIYDHKYLAVKITDFCLPSEKLIKCLTLLKHLTVSSRKLFLLLLCCAFTLLEFLGFFIIIKTKLNVFK